ncbi:MAG: hypothetical protein FWD04_03765 [Conexibacteraceae bacterium]|nr:hypothetical protein [Conexibacteraceae bacterium]
MADESTNPGAVNPEELTEEQLRAAYEQEIKRVRVEHVLLENVVTMVNLGMRRTGLMAGTEDERDLAQVQLAIESVRALMPQLEQVAPAQVPAIRDALSQLQVAYVQTSGGDAPAGTPGGGPADAPAAEKKPDEKAGPAQSSGRLWVPGQP